MKKEIKRKQLGERSPSIPQPIPSEPGMVKVESTWGEIQPLQVADGVRTVAELDVIHFLENGQPVIDARTEDFYHQATLLGAKNIPHTQAAERMHELDRSQETLFFCNGPQCGQSPAAIKALMKAGFPADKMLYYRGGMHDWMTLGLPTETPAQKKE